MHEGKPYNTPRPPPLPSFRVEEAPPFSFTGVDFAGPLYIKSIDGTQKVWICLYTCCVARAVHLELVPDLSTPAFLQSLKCFTSRRGLPSKIVSDNGKTFKAAASHLMIGQRLMSLPDYLHSCHGPEEFEATHDILTRRARYLNTTMDWFG